jgi:hypothetical protein
LSFIGQNSWFPSNEWLVSEWKDFFMKEWSGSYHSRPLLSILLPSLQYFCLAEHQTLKLVLPGLGLSAVPGGGKKRFT